MSQTDNKRFPIGEFELKEKITPESIAEWINEIERAPAKLREAVADLTDEQLDTRYRPEGWTVRQVVHHLADSHMNSYIRFKWTLTEDKPTIKAYDEKAWAELGDGKSGPLELSLNLLDALHRRWAYFLRTVDRDDLRRTFVHPESGDEIRLDVAIAFYAWHGLHHIAHITSLREREGWGHHPSSEST